MRRSNEERAKKYLLLLVNKRKNKEINLQEFLHELSFVENTFKVNLGMEYMEFVTKYVADLEGALDNEFFRYYRNEMTRKEQEDLIIDNILKFCAK